MKAINNILSILNFRLPALMLMSVALTAGLTMTSCSDDDLDESIFDTDPSIDYLDVTSYTFPLDTFCKVTYLEPYNLKFIYKMEDMSSDMDKNLTPAEYDKSVDLAVLSKYLWFDVYKNVAGEVFLKTYSPREIQVVGSKNYNPTSGTETLGDASGGVRINLYNANNLDYTDVDMMNEYFFRTMHHEFSHILDQTYVHPTAFNVLSNSQYDSSGWSDAADSVKAGLGFVTPYASSSYSEDWAETMANYITRDTLSWTQLLSSASYEWEEIDIDSETAYNKLIAGNVNKDTIGYFKESENGDYKIYRRKCLRNDDDTVILDSDGNVQWIHETGIDGKELILQKVEYVTDYLKEYFDINIQDLRTAVQTRTYVTDSDGEFTLDDYGELVNMLATTLDDGTIFMDSLRQEVYQYEELQGK